MTIRAWRCLVLTAVTALPWPAMAACLLSDYSVPAEYNRSAAVVTARVISERPAAESAGYYEGVTYTVAVEKVYRGEIRGAVDIFSENSSGRFPMQTNGRYVLFIYGEAGRMMVDNCGNSGPVAEKTEVLRVLDRLVGQRGRKNPNELRLFAARSRGKWRC